MNEPSLNATPDSAAPTKPPPLWIRGLIALGAGAWGVALVLMRGGDDRDMKDLDQAWYAARALIAGGNPYDVVGPGQAFEWGWPLLYPLPAVLIAVPFSFANLPLARLLFVAISSALLGFAFTRHGYHRLLVFGSMAYLFAAVVAQWEILLSAAAILPFAGWALAAKPNIGLALLVAYPRRQAFIALAAILTLSIVLMPGWPLEWWKALDNASHIRPPVTYAGGIFLLLALLRWRRPEARLLAALACTPHNIALYALIPLFLIPATLGESLILAWCTWIAKLILDASHHGPWESYDQMFAFNGTFLVPLVYLPALIMVLRRPNEGDVPDWVDRGLRKLFLRLPGRNRVLRSGTSHAQ
ncbi:MAG: hypothetical protein H0W30_18660 [Gemmatimonadaceae bacterium]|nr:hypothetical protein [Gemmatimonadaceae bacterium]MDQ3520436.1 hypothetical protein [Gemmatimonadota bacterium]